jgi:hypothetical protein
MYVTYVGISFVLTDYEVSVEICRSFYQLLNLVVWLCKKETHMYSFIQICLGFLFS